jgi:D-glycero-alpha-D-manno-heptose 1-phosphate guanylyltransferase
MRCIILCGGFGTRLRSITGESTPKCMVKGSWGWIHGSTRELPWLEIPIRELRAQGISDITLALHYKAEVFMDWFKDKLKYKIEKEPLGTGGAIRDCLEDNESTLVMNGDTISTCDFQDMLANHVSPLSVAVTQDKGNTTSAGIYIVNKELFDDAPDGAFSFENFIMNKKKKFYNIKWFRDMGTPETYKEAQVHD